MKTILSIFALLIANVYSNAVCNSPSTFRSSQAQISGKETYEWRVSDYKNTKGDLVLEYTFYQSGYYIKYQRIETENKTYDKVFRQGTWKTKGNAITFSTTSDNKLIKVSFNPDKSQVNFHYKIFDKQKNELLNKYTYKFSRLPVSSKYPQNLTNFN